MVTGWAGRQDAPQLSIYQVLRDLADQQTANGRDQFLENDLFREQVRLDGDGIDTGNQTRFKHMMQRAAARLASVVTSVRSVLKNCACIVDINEKIK
jgi:hypothetical protein